MDGGWADLGLWRVDRPGGAPLFRQLYLQVRGAILDRTLGSGARLPASRELAARLGVSRTTVVQAYALLQAEGWLTSRTGSGAYVSADLPQPFAVRRAPSPDRAEADGVYAPNREDLFGPFVRSDQPEPARPFAMGHCLMDARSSAAWRRAAYKSARTFSPEHLAYGDPRGLIELRRAISDYLRAARAVRCDPDQVVVTSGAQHAIDIATRALLGAGDEVWVEDPAYPLTCRGLVQAGMRTIPVPVDAEGMDVAAGVRLAPLARAAVVTPSHQYPTGAVLSLARRLELLAWARTAGAWIIEDDYDSELRHRGRPLASLQGLDEAGRVIYVGTLNKALFPGLRIGYAVVPRPVLDVFVNARRLTDRQPASMGQTVLAAFMHDGQLLAHFRRLRQAYRQVQEPMVRILLERLGEDRVTIDLPDQGNHLVAWLPEGASDVAIEQAALERGIVCRAISRLYLAAPARPGLMLGFTGFTAEAAARAAAILAEAIAAGLDGQARLPAG